MVWSWCWHGFPICNTKNTSNKSENSQMELYQIKKTFCLAEEIINRIKRTIYTMGENVCKPCIWWGVNIQNK
jgi:hypothetical protein